MMPPPPPRRSGRPDRRGGVAIFVALVLVVLLAFVALVVDLGYVSVVHAQLQAGADAAALAGAARLDGTARGLVEAQETALGVGLSNEANGEPLDLQSNVDNLPDGGIVLGHWDADAEAFTPSMNPAEVDAVQVQVSTNDLAALFAQVAFGRDRLSAAARAIAWAGGSQGAGKVPYYLPFGLPSCFWDEHSSEELMDMEFVLSPAGADNTGWATLGAWPNAADLVNHLAALLPCIHEYHNTGTVSDACMQGNASDPTSLGSGVAASALSALADAVEQGVPWNPGVWGDLPAQHNKSAIDPGLFGNVLEGPLPVFAAGPDYCGSGGSWNETAPTLGFVWGAIYDVRTMGSAASKNIWLRIDMSTLRTVGTGGGGGNYGITAPSPAVVVR